MNVPCSGAPTTRVHVSDLDTPVGTLRLAARVGADGAAEQVVAAAFADHFDRVAAGVAQRRPTEGWVEATSRSATRVAAYLAGDLAALDDLDVDVAGTAFQRRVWGALRRIPVGETWSYARLARSVDNPRAVRAVGGANGANPVCVIVPCHRVVRADGSPGGYAGGPERKIWLLEHERARLGRSPQEHGAS